MGCVPLVGLHHLHTGDKDKPRSEVLCIYCLPSPSYWFKNGSKKPTRVPYSQALKTDSSPQPCHEITSAHLTPVAMATCVSACSAAKCVPFDLGVSPRAEDRGYTRRKKGRKKVCFHVIRGFQYQLIFT